MNDTSKKIETLLDDYFCKLRKEADNNWTDAYKKAEDFYCRFLNKLYGWRLYNRNYIKRNESDIDLSSFDKKITVAFGYLWKIDIWFYFNETPKCDVVA